MAAEKWEEAWVEERLDSEKGTDKSRKLGGKSFEADNELAEAKKELRDAREEATARYVELSDAKLGKVTTLAEKSDGTTRAVPPQAPLTWQFERGDTIGKVQEGSDFVDDGAGVWDKKEIIFNDQVPAEGEHIVWATANRPGEKVWVGTLVDGRFDEKESLQSIKVGADVFLEKTVDIPIDKIPPEDLRAHIAASEAAGDLEAAAKYQTALDRLEFERLTKIQIDMLFPEDLKALLAASEALGEDEIAKNCRAKLASQEAPLEPDHTTEDTAETLLKAVEGGTLPQAKPRGEEADDPIK